MRARPWSIAALTGALTFACLAASVHALDPSTPPDGYAVREWHTEHGIPSSRVRAVTQSTDGYLWVATAYGLAQFDGRRFVRFSGSTREDLKAVNFYDIAHEPGGTVWFASNAGVYRYKDGEFRCFDHTHGLPTRQVRSVRWHQDYLVVGLGSTVARIRGDHVERPKGWDRIRGNTRIIQPLADGSFVVGGTEGIWKVKGDAVVPVQVDAARRNLTYTSLWVEEDGHFWLGTNQGLFRVLPDGTTEDWGTRSGMGSLSIESLFRDGGGTLWLGTAAGLFRLNGAKAEQVAAAEIGVSLVMDMIEGQEGELWVASSSGLYQLRDTPIRSVGSTAGLRQVLVNTVMEASDGALWLGLWTGGVYRHHGGRAEPIPVLSTGRPRVYYSLAEDAEGALWIGGDVSLYRHRDGQYENFCLPDIEAWTSRLKADPALVLPGVPSPRINTITADRSGGLWIGAQPGLYRRDERGFHLEPGFLESNVRSIVCARDGSVWGTIGGSIWRKQNGKWAALRTGEGVGVEAGRALYEDDAGSIWVTSGNGLHRHRQGRWSTFTVRDGMIDNFVTGVVQDNAGNLWIGSPRGVMSVPLVAFDDLRAGRITHLPVRAFNRSDGMPDSDCAEPGAPSAARTGDGRLLFPTASGVAVIDPTKLRHNTRIPPVHIESFLVDGVSMKMVPAATLPSTHRDVQFHFTATSLLLPEKVRFRVRLLPLDREWIDLGEARTIRYPHLSHGHYAFQVIAANNDGVWNQTGATLAFQVAPAWYQTLGFRLAAAVAVALLAGLAYRLRVKQLRLRAAALQQQNAELERRVEQRTAELGRSYETLRASEYFYHSLVESLPQIIVRKDVQGRFTYANAAFADLMGLPLDKIIGATEASLYPAEFADKVRSDDQRIMQTREVMEYERVVEKDGRKRFLHVKKVPLYDDQQKPIGVQVLFWDMTVFRETEEKLRRAQHELLETSRLAGIAEVATGVLHNIGNALNSVNISATLAAEHLASSKAPSLSRVAQMLAENRDRLVEFFATDPRGAQLPQYLEKLGQVLEDERSGALQEVRGLQAGVEHIKQIVAAQQSHAQVSGLVENVDPAELVEYALRISEASLERHGVSVAREFLPVPKVKVQRQKALQILVNLLRNAKEALASVEQAEKRILVGLRTSSAGAVQIFVDDNGVGIAQENLTRVFAFGYTTKKDGHGFGLHSSALAAREMGGSLAAHSDGVGRGARFVLELPGETAGGGR